MFTECSCRVQSALAGGAGRSPALTSLPAGTPVCDVPGKVTPVPNFLARIVAWITAGYPEGVPGPDRVPLLALLRRRLTDDEVTAVAQTFIDRGEFDQVDIAVMITSITDDMPTPADIERVRARLGHDPEEDG